jgi:hypothetical protein
VKPEVKNSNIQISDVNKGKTMVRSGTDESMISPERLNNVMITQLRDDDNRKKVSTINRSII